VRQPRFAGAEGRGTTALFLRGGKPRRTGITPTLGVFAAVFADTLFFSQAAPLNRASATQAEP